MDIHNSKTSFPSLCLLIFIQIFLSRAPPITCSFSFSFPSFTNNLNEIITQGTAYISENGSVELTPTSGTPYYLLGRVVYSQPVLLWDSFGTLSNFSTYFSFTISPMNLSNGSGDGIIFFLSPYPSIIPPNSGAEYFGVFNASIVPNTIGVEFDNYLNPDLYDVSSNHIGIDIERPVSAASTDLKFNMSNGYKSDAWINYDSNTHNLSVFFSYAQLNKNWSLSYIVDLRKYLPREVAIGIGAATGGYFQQNTLLSWNFTSSLSPSPPPVPPPLRPPIGTREEKTLNVYQVIVPIFASVIVLGMICLLGSCYYFCVRKKRYHNINKSLVRTKQFTYDELVMATQSFSRELALGRGASGEVFKGTLSNPNIEVAVKRIIGTSSLHGNRAYEAELDILSRLNHRNLVHLKGYCDENDHLLLVYEYMPNRSLDCHLYDDTSELEWPQRYNSAIGLASALSYLHEGQGYSHSIIHRDVKPSNVMLDLKMNAKLGDFGIARLVDHGNIMQSTAAAGTFGYIAPEIYVTLKASQESDVYSFGIVVLEIACGKKPMEIYDNGNVLSLARYVYKFYKSNELLRVVDTRLKEFDSEEMERLLLVGLSCCHPNPEQRMSMRKAISTLKFDSEIVNLVIEYHDNDNSTSSNIIY